jgi:hypothetical protein
MGNHESQRAAAQSPVSLGSTALAVANHSQTTANTVSDHSRDENRTQTAHAEGHKPHTGLSTDDAQTSDTAKRKQFELRLDQLMVKFLLDLATISQVKAAPTEVQAADANAVRLPVSKSGKALTEDPVGQLALDYKRAGNIRDLKRRLSLKVQIATKAQTEIRSCRYSRRHAPDLGTQDGRLAVARFAREHGTRRAAETYCHNPDDPRSVKTMQRNVQRYMIELDKVEASR